ncbi:hypothetical protein JCM19992_17400 [Thermostilla marina]
MRPAHSWKVAIAFMTTAAFAGVVGLAAILVTATVLDALGDVAGAIASRYVALGVGVLLAIDVVCLLLTVGYLIAASLSSGPSDDDPPNAD